MGPTGEMMITYRATNALLTNSGCGAVLTVTGDDVKSVQGVPKKNALSEPRLLPVLLSPKLGKQLISWANDELLP